MYQIRLQILKIQNQQNNKFEKYENSSVKAAIFVLTFKQINLLY